MHLKDLRQNWERMGREDPLWAVSTAPQYKGGRWDPDAFFASGAEDVRRILDQLRRVRPLKVHTALDFGCGVGRLTQALAVACPEATVIGVDISPAMIDHAHRFASERRCDRVRFSVNERPDLSMFDDRSFDLVLTEITLLHMEPRFSFEYIREFIRVLRPGGAAIFEVPEPTRRQTVRGLVPRPIVTLGNKMRTIRSPIMEMYGLARHDVFRVVHDAGGHVFALYDKGREHGEYADLRYFVGSGQAPVTDPLWVPSTVTAAAAGD